MSLVLDTDVMVAALRSPRGASAELLRQVLVGERLALASVPLFVEYEAVMTRPGHLQAAGATVADVRNLLDVLAGVVRPVEIHYLWRPQLTDANDEMVLECAANGGARYLATFNVEDFTGVAERFGVRPLMPGQILKEPLL
ncbi:MAG: putative toxin-antitoxin system toxin component, PIN family [Proteobacteria bacterium]|nr:putative toxin-antitoxin system toxin component, PIN family [Pseudomonadota bacterium]